jgi:EmrB/QacA subfamily drug resistance transporter
VSPDTHRQHFGLTLAVLAVAALAFALLQTMVAPALPSIQKELGSSNTAVTWVLTVNLLSASVCTPILGRLGDMFGKERVLVVVLVLLALGTVVAGLSHSLPVLIAGRAIQGAGGAVFPLAFGIIRDEFPPAKVGAGIGLISATFGVGGGGGLVLAGVIVDHLSYRWIFWFALVLILAAIVATHFFVPESPIKSPAKIDWLGALGLGLGLTCILIAVSEGNNWGWTSGRVIGLVAAGLAVLLAWARWETRVPEPMVDTRMLRLRGVWTTNLTALLTGFGMFGAYLLLPQIVQMPPHAGFGFGATPTEAGLFLLPSALVMLIAGPLAGSMSARFGGRVPLLLGIVIATASFVMLAFAHDERWEIYVASGLNGFGIGLTFASMATIIVDAVPPAQTSVATGMNTLLRTVGGALGAQIAATVVSGHIGAGGLPEEIGFTAAFATSAAALGLALLAGLLIPRRSDPVASVPHGHARLGEPRPAATAARP